MIADHPPPHQAGVHSRRVIFIDLVRALAVVFMLYGHAIDALLAPEYRSGAWFDAWQFQRGLTSCLFFLSSGFAFSIATSRHWAAQITLSRPLLKRARRFGLFILLGYALHVPLPVLRGMATATDAQWRSFLAVDVLQLIGVTFCAVQILAMVTRSQRVFMVATLVLAAAIAAATPLVWSIEWTRLLPLTLASYLSDATGSQFPMFPWTAYILVGAGLGQVYAHWGAAHLFRYANAVLLLPGAIMVALWLALGRVSAPIFGTGSFSFIPELVLVRTGVCLILAGVVAHASRRMTGLPHIVGALAQETLLVYFVHLCIVYGSPWNIGLAQVYGLMLQPRELLVAIALLIVAMTVLAWYWNWWKHTRPTLARWMSVAASGLLFSLLF